MAADQPRSPQNMLTRLTPDMVADFTKAGFWSDDTIHDCVLNRAATRPDAIAVRDQGIALTYGDLADLARGLAARLAAAGLKPGDRVAAWISSRAELAVLLSACAAGGFVLCPSLHRNHTVGEICILLGRMRARALVVEAGFGADADRHDILKGAAEIADLAYTCLLSRPAARTADDIATALDLGEGAEPASRTGTDIVYLAFTSGTTGEPKGVMHSSNTLLANARAIAADWGFDADSVTYTLGPLSHNLGFGALVLTLLSGGELVIHDLPRGQALLPRLRELGATFLFGVPAHAMDLLVEIETETARPVLPDLKGFRISGAAVPGWVVERLLTHGITPQSGYGMTEACSHHYTHPGDAPERVVGTSGRACPGYEVKVFAIDDPNRELPAGEIGHIGGRGASLMMGYFDDQNATERAFNANGWFMTGDLGRMDEDGYLTLTGRLKEIIIRGGHNIHPARIEQLTMRHPGVERVAALGVRDERLGEKVCLVVMPKNGGLDPQDVLTHLHDAGLSKYDMPEYYLEVDEIPLSASGKMLKRALLPDIDAGRLKPVPVRFSGAA
ncbi:class I adenylate-forming enzyme family protein [Chachezhania sediminis]|uniref:class I adenylate-forming enzyme family protein n=1 Tax=Chachezhania sediminis TaxID=2599291 RepID=UPI001E2D79AF|nr:class I adenylate-forming enzyme family protein [Chachezhania sediminis]